MCGEKAGCEKPQELKGQPAECSPEQVRKCHGDVKDPVKDHPCVLSGGKGGRPSPAES